MHGSAERRAGYQEAMRRHGLADHIRVVPGGPGEEDGARAAEKLLADPPTAVSATGLFDVLRRNGLSVPGQVSVVGYDDTSLSRPAHIDLTTIAQDIDALAARAIDRAVERIEGVPAGPRAVAIPPRLVVRSTTGPAPG